MAIERVRAVLALLGGLWIVAAMSAVDSNPAAAQDRQWTWIDGGDAAVVRVIPDGWSVKGTTAALLDDRRLVAVGRTIDVGPQYARVVAWTPDGDVSFDTFPAAHGAAFSSTLAVHGDTTFVGQTATVTKLDGQGQRVWRTRIDISIVAMAAASDGALYVAGAVGPGVDAVLVRLSAEGTVDWTRPYEGTWPGPSESQDLWWDLVVRGDDSVCVTGSTFGSTGNGLDVIVACYAEDGTELWFEVYNGPEDRTDYGQAIAADELGAIYIAGEQRTDAGNYPISGHILKYSSTGSLDWVRTPVGVSNGSYPEISVEGGIVVSSFVGHTGNNSELVLTQH